MSESMAESTIVVDVEQTPRAQGDFEQRRAIAAARARLFGGGTMPMIGRYAIERRIGRGGMGEVYRGVDPELGRTVAIKRLREDVLPVGPHGRLLDEARALAKISHPNVVSVFEVGVHEDRAFVAMEFVEGETLRAWAKSSRGWRELLAVHIAAGRGLAAAHAAGIVHRDFKPDNVLIGVDERVRVADFGLALGLDARLIDEPATPIAGTVRYMSPEQLRGETVDARSDQFSFCVVLYEALWGLPPFELGNVERHLAALEANAPQRPPPGGVPRSLWPCIRRGLQHDPAQRWDSLDDLLDVLESLPRRRRRWLLGALALPLVLGFGWLALRDDGEVCEGVSGELAQAWNPTRQEQLAATIGAASVAHGHDTASRVSARLDAWASAWRGARTEQCQAAAQQRDTDIQVDARRRCLEHQRETFVALIDALDHVDVNTVDHVLAAVDELPDPNTCSAIAALDRDGEREPLGVELATARVQHELEQLAAVRRLGRPDLAAARTQLAHARSLGHPPTIIDALTELGHDELAAGSPVRGLQLLDEATGLAMASGDRSRIAATLLDGASYRLAEYPSEDAALRLTWAQAAWQDAQPDARTLTRLAFGHARLESGEPARAWLQRALETASESQRPALLTDLARLSDDADQALVLFERAAGLAELSFGPRHPETATHLFNLGVALLDRGERERAQPPLERAASIWMRAHARPHPNLARAHLLLASAAIEGDALERAELHAREVIAIHDLTLPPAHHDRGIGPMLLSRIAALRGDRVAALRHATQASEHYARADGPRAFTVLEMRLDAASSRFGLGDVEAAELDYREILALTDDPRLTSLAWLGLAELELHRGRLELARAQLDIVDDIGLAWLGQQRISYDVLDALVDVRRGCRECAAVDAAAIATQLREQDREPSSLRAWLIELGVTPDEAERLGLAL